MVELLPNISDTESLAEGESSTQRLWEQFQREMLEGRLVCSSFATELFRFLNIRSADWNRSVPSVWPGPTCRRPHPLCPTGPNFRWLLCRSFRTATTAFRTERGSHISATTAKSVIFVFFRTIWHLAGAETGGTIGRGSLPALQPRSTKISSRSNTRSGAPGSCRSDEYE